MFEDWLLQELFGVAVMTHFMAKAGLNSAPALGKQKASLIARQGD